MARLKTKLSLRARIALAFAVLGAIVSTALALIAIHFSDAYVNRVVVEMLRVEGEFQRDRFAAEGRAPPSRSRHFTTYQSVVPAIKTVTTAALPASAAERGTLPPPEIENLPPGGPYEIDSGGAARFVAIYDVATVRLYVVLDLGFEEVRERRLMRDLIAIVLFGSGLSAWLGWFWAGRAIAPVRLLARRVDVLQPSLQGVVPIAPDFAADEVGTLAQAFDRYQEKLYDFVRRERTFTADASHELRTPLAVIRGAIEVMLDSGNADAGMAKRLQRMQRGADELRDLLDALLVLARTEDANGRDENVPDLDALVASIVLDRAAIWREQAVTVVHDRGALRGITAPQKVVRVVIANLLRAITQFASGGTLYITVRGSQLCIEYSSVTLLHDTPTLRALTPPRVGNDEGPVEKHERMLGLGMIRRVCERWNWHLEESAGIDGNCAFVLHF